MTTQTHNETLIRKLTECALECHKCMAACLEEEDVSMMARCIELDLDCAEICTTTAAYVVRNSESMATLLAICGEICKACAEECQKHDAAHCQQCAAVCFECAELCEQE
jgi:hypothetical protein